MCSDSNEIIISFCADSRHTLLYFISFCVDDMKSVLNTTHFVLCHDRGHTYSIVMIFMNLVELKKFGEVFFKINTGVRFRLVINSVG